MKRLFTLMICSGAASSAAADSCKQIKDLEKRCDCYEIALAAAEKSANVQVDQDLVAEANNRTTPVPLARLGAAQSANSAGKGKWVFVDGGDPAKDSSRPEQPTWLSPLIVQDRLDSPKKQAKGASLGVSTSNGQTSIKSSLAATYGLPTESLFPDVMARNGWSAGIGTQWTKDNTVKTKVDGRVIRLFSSGTVEAGVPVVTTLKIDGVEDNVSKERSIGLRLNGTPVFGFSEGGIPYDGSPHASPAYLLYAGLGPHLDRVTYAKSPSTAGNAIGLNGRVDADFFPNGALWPIHLFATAVRARDIYTSAGLEKRSSTYYDFGVEWALVRPDKKGTGVVPALSLHRTIGDNFLDGTSRSVKTSLALTLKVN